MYWLLFLVTPLVSAKPFAYTSEHMPVIRKNDGDTDDTGLSFSYLKEMHIPPYMADLYKVLSKKETNGNLLHNGNVVRSFFDQGSAEEERERRQYLFNVSNIADEMLIRAELHIYMYPSIEKHKRLGIIQLGVKNLADNQTVSSRLLSSNKSGWLVFPITELVSNWIKTKHTNKGIRMSVRFIYGKDEMLYFATKESILKEPILVTFSSDTRQHMLKSSIENIKNSILNANRIKQHVHAGKERQRRDLLLKPCGIIPLSVPVYEIGWGGHILRPLTFSINQCAGQCVGENQSNHAVLQGLYATVTDGREASFPCCAPLKLGNTTVLMKDEKTNVLKLVWLENSIAESCKCL